MSKRKPYPTLTNEDTPQRRYELREMFNALRWIEPGRGAKLGAHDQRDVSHSVRTNSDENWPMSRAPSQLMGPPVRLTERGSAAVLPLFY
ncbi:hypothetical protein NY025_20400 [Ralstonia pseudosolanacearum]|nr:hypothetical protein [Ralstonia pseudosolanacearum]UWD90022.1 hypothetical protein NY025_20400 [Ralstonia pseudosolanacearum]